MADLFLYAGTLTRLGRSDGLYVLRLTPDGSFAQLQVVALADPSFVAVDRCHGAVHAASHTATFDGAPGGGISSWRIGDDGCLTELSREVVPCAHPAHLALDRTERWALLACTMGGGVAVAPVGDDGAVGPVLQPVLHDGPPMMPLGSPEVPSVIPAPGSPMPHCMVPDLANAHVVVPDMGRDRIVTHRFDAATGVLSPVASTAAPAGAGPRHAAFHPRGDVLYVVEERSSSITSYRYDPATGALERAHTVRSVPADHDGPNLPAEVRVHPSGRWLLVSNRGHDSIVCCEIGTPATELRVVGWQRAGVAEPRGFSLVPGTDLVLVANQSADTITSYVLDPASGALDPTGSTAAVPSPTCLATYPSPVEVAA